MNLNTQTTVSLAIMAAVTLNLASVARAADTPPVPTVKSGIEKCEVRIPKGEFAQVRIEFDVPVSWTLLATMRDGRIRVDDTIGILEPGGWLEVKDGKITGSFRRFIPGSRATAVSPLGQTAQRMHQFEVEGTVTGDAIAGTCKVPTAATTKESTTGTISGVITREAALAKDNALPAGVSWDSFLGSTGMGGAAVPTSTVPLVFDRVRLQWRSEEPLGEGLAPLSRFMWRYGEASSLRTSSGSFSPALGDGKVFCYMRVPLVGPLPANNLRGRECTYEADAKELGVEKIPGYVLEKGYAVAEEVVVAMDAATGKTLWRAEVGLGVPNLQGHKERNSDRTPAYADGKVFVPGRAGHVYAFDANTGKPLWQAPCMGEAVGIVATPDVVVVPASTALGRQWQGVDPKTGAALWTMDGKAETWSPSRWAHGGKTYIIAAVNLEPNREKPSLTNLVCVDPVTGAPLWKTPVLNLFSHAGVTVSGDLLMGYFDLDPSTKKQEGTDEDGSLLSIGKPAVCAYRLSAKGAEKQWEYSGVGYPYAVPVVVAEKYTFVCSAGATLFTGKGNMKAAVIELATGKVMDEMVFSDQEGGMYLPCNGGYVQALGNLVYTRPDGTHGNNQFAFYTVSPQGKVTAKTPWEPPQYGGRTHTTSYHHPIMYALADGRMFLRQYDGIYCYDLRATAAAKKVGQAVQTAGEDPVRVREALCALSQDADPAVREEAVRILVRHVTTTKAVKPTPALLQVLTSAVGGDNAKNEMVSQALAVFGAESVPVVAGLAKEQDPVRRLFAMQTLARLKDVSGATVDELLRTGIGDKVLAVSEAALKAVEVRGASAASFVPELIRWVDEEPPTRGVAAARALLAVQPVGGKPDPLPKTYEAKLVELMAVWQEDDMLNRVLGAIRGLGDEAALRIAVDVLENSDALRGIRACHVLGGLGPKAASAIPALESAKKKWGGRGFVNAANGALKQITPGK